MDSITQQGIYIFGVGVGGIKPCDYGLLLHINGDAYIQQTVLNLSPQSDQSDLYYIRSQTGTAWQRVTLNMPTFYKDYLTLASLASALGALCQYSVIDSGDVNALDSGIYGVNAQLTNAPSGTGASMLIVMNTVWMRCDVIFDRGNSRILYRFKWGSAGFEEWKIIS